MKPRGSLRSGVFPLRSELLLPPHQVDESGWQMPQRPTLSNSTASQKAPTLLPHCSQDAPSARVIFQH